MSLHSGTRLGPYEIADKIGEGGMGQVYRARDLTLRRDVAVKMIAAPLAHDDEAWARFARRIRDRNAVHHSHLTIPHE